MAGGQNGHEGKNILTGPEGCRHKPNKTLAPLTDDLQLLYSDVNSLRFAILVVRVEDLIGSDPFTREDETKFPETVGELITLYESSTV
jgi:hypothetical protein